MSNLEKIIYIIAGPNGAGKTTFANSFIPSTQNLNQFINADLIAYGLSPFAPEREAVQAGKIMLRQIDKLVAKGENFCIETTLSGKGYAQKIPKWQMAGYTICLIFLTLPDAETAIARVAKRVEQGGHNIPEVLYDVVFLRENNFLKYCINRSLNTGFYLITVLQKQYSLREVENMKIQISQSDELLDKIKIALDKARMQAREIATSKGTSLVVSSVKKSNLNQMSRIK